MNIYEIIQVVGITVIAISFFGTMTFFALYKPGRKSKQNTRITNKKVVTQIEDFKAVSQ